MAGYLGGIQDAQAAQKLGYNPGVLGVLADLGQIAQPNSALTNLPSLSTYGSLATQPDVYSALSTLQQQEQGGIAGTLSNLNPVAITLGAFAGAGIGDVIGGLGAGAADAGATAGGFADVGTPLALDTTYLDAAAGDVGAGGATAAGAASGSLGGFSTAAPAGYTTPAAATLGQSVDPTLAASEGLSTGGGIPYLDPTTGAPAIDPSGGGGAAGAGGIPSSFDNLIPGAPGGSSSLSISPVATPTDSYYGDVAGGSNAYGIPSSFDNLIPGAGGDTDPSLWSQFKDFISPYKSDINLGGNVLSGIYDLSKANQIKQLGNTLTPQVAPNAPYTTSYAKQLNDLISNPNSITQDPLYQADFAQGSQAVQRAAAAQGYTGSGNAQIALQQYGQQFFNDEYNAQVEQLQGLTRPNTALAQTQVQTAAIESQLYQAALKSLGSGVSSWLLS